MKRTFLLLAMLVGAATVLGGAPAATASPSLDDSRQQVCEPLTDTTAASGQASNAEDGCDSSSSADETTYTYKFTVYGPFKGETLSEIVEQPADQSSVAVAHSYDNPTSWSVSIPALAGRNCLVDVRVNGVAVAGAETRTTDFFGTLDKPILVVFFDYDPGTADSFDLTVVLTCT